MRRAIHPGQAILENLGITDKEIVSFTVECQGVEHIPTITLVKLVLGAPEPTYALITRVVIGDELLQFDIDAACLSAKQVIDHAIDTAYQKSRAAVIRDFMHARERLGRPMRPGIIGATS